MGPPLQFRCSLRERCKPQLGRSVHHSRNGARPTDCAPQYVMISARLYSAHVMHNAASPAPANQTTTFLRIRIAPGTLKSGSCFSSPKNCSALWLSLDTCGLTCIAINTTVASGGASTVPSMAVHTASGGSRAHLQDSFGDSL